MALAIAASSSLICAVSWATSASCVSIVFWAMTLSGELGVALEVALGVGELRLVERLLGDRLVELGLIGGRIDQGEHVTALHVLALLELDAEDLAVDLRAHRYGVARLGRADAIEVDGHIARSEHRHRGPERRIGQHLGAPAGGLLLHGGHDRHVTHQAGDGGSRGEGDDSFQQPCHLTSFHFRLGGAWEPGFRPLRRADEGTDPERAAWPGTVGICPTTVIRPGLPCRAECNGCPLCKLLNCATLAARASCSGNSPIPLQKRAEAGLSRPGPGRPSGT